MAEPVSIVVPTHNRARLLSQALESLSQLDRPDGQEYEILVVANACSDDTLGRAREVAERTGAPIRVVEEAEPNLNVARNRGLSSTRGELVAFLDDDVWVEKGWLRALIEVCREQSADLVAGRVQLWWEAVAAPPWLCPGVERLLSRLDHGDQILELHRPGQLVGANFAIRRSAFDRLDGFRAGLDRSGPSLLSGGETELAGRALELGLRMFYAPGMAVRHWIPPQRIAQSHLDALARGRGATRVALTSHLPTRLKLVRLGLAQVVLGGWREMRAAGDPVATIEGRLLRMRGLGTLIALGRALLGRRRGS